MPSPSKSQVTTAPVPCLYSTFCHLNFYLVFLSPEPLWFGKGIAIDRIILLNIFIRNLKWWRRYKEMLFSMSSLPKMHLLGFYFSIYFHGRLWPLGPRASLGLDLSFARNTFSEGPHIFPPSLCSLNLFCSLVEPSVLLILAVLSVRHPPTPSGFPSFLTSSWLFISSPLSILSSPCHPP